MYPAEGVFGGDSFCIIRAESPCNKNMKEAL